MNTKTNMTMRWICNEPANTISLQHFGQVFYKRQADALKYRRLTLKLKRLKRQSV